MPAIPIAIAYLSKYYYLYYDVVLFDIQVSFIADYTIFCTLYSFMCAHSNTIYE